jgi:hypothetical protein
LVVILRIMGFAMLTIVGPHPNEVNIGDLAIKIVHTIFALMYKFGFHFEVASMGGQPFTIPGKIPLQSFSLTQMTLEMYEYQYLAPHLGDICILVAPILEEYFVRY